MNEKQAIGVGLIGYGYAGSVFHAPLIGCVPGLRLAAVASGSPAKVKADWPDVPVDASPAGLLARPEVALVVIATPNHLHFDLARQALLAGKHVVVDKPFALASEEADELVRLAGRRQLFLSAFHNRRWDSDFLTLRRLLQAGRLGRVSYFESRFERFRPQVRDRWRERADDGGGLWYDLGPHLVDQALQLFGMPSTVDGALEMQRHGARADDYFRVQLIYPQMRVVLQASMLGCDDGPRFIVQGSGGHYVKYGFDPQEAALKRGERPGSAAWGSDPRPGVLTRLREDRAEAEVVPALAGDYSRYYLAVRDALLAGAPNPVPGEAAAAGLRLMALARESHRLGRTLAVPQFHDQDE